MKKHREEFMTKRQEQANETKKMQENLEAAQKKKQATEEALAQLEQDETNTKQRNKNNIEREENLWVYKQFHDKVANKEWLALQPLEIKKRDWITKKLKKDHPEKDITTLPEEEYNQYQEEFIKLVKDNEIPIPNPEEEFQVYFKKPEDLYEIFTSLEEQNLQLIQKNQGLLKEIEEKKTIFAGTKARIEQNYNTRVENERKLTEKTKEEDKRNVEEKLILESQEDEQIATNLAALKVKIYKVFTDPSKAVHKKMGDIPTEKLIENLAVTSLLSN